MELRRCNFHYINAIKTGLSAKAPNVSRGRPGLKFRKVKDILESENAENQNSICSRALFSCYAPNIEPKSEPIEFDFIVSHDSQNSNQVDRSFGGDMTLKQIKEKCKAKKRKLSSYVDSSEQTIETKLQLNDEEIDLSQPLSSFKSKLFKNKKSKKKKRTENSLSQSALAVVKSELFSSYDEFLQSNGPVKTGIEVPGVNCDSQDMLCEPSDSSQSCDRQMGFGGGLSSEVPKTGNDHELPTSSTLMSTKESQSSANEDSHGPLEHMEPDLANCVMEPAKEFQSPVNENSHEFEERAEPDLANCVRASAKEPQSPVNEKSHEVEEHVEPDLADGGTSTSEILRLDSPEKRSPHEPEFPRSEFQVEGHMIESLPVDIYSASVLQTVNHFPKIHDNSLSNSSMHKRPFQIPSGNNYQSGSISSSDTRKCTGEQSACLLADDINNDLPSNLEAGAIIPDDCRTSCNFDLCSRSNDCLGSVPCDSSITEQKQCQSSSLAHTAKICSVTIDPDDHSSEQMTLSKVDHQHTKPQNTPERLFSTRKAISPTSQEKLCKAMGSVQLKGNVQNGCKGKLYFGKPTQIRRADISTNKKHLIKKTKYKEDSHRKGSQSCSQTAIKFSQQQMRDAECIADRLTKELNSMKEIVRDAVYFEASSTAALKQNVDKVRVAIGNATKLEEFTKQYLSMMARDCSRFCKIMKLSDNDDYGASNNVVTPKERKKIIFADEDGKRLCHVKVIDDESAVLMESSGVKQEVLVK